MVRRADFELLKDQVAKIGKDVDELAGIRREVIETHTRIDEMFELLKRKGK